MSKIDVSEAAEIVLKNLPESPDVARRMIEEMNLATQPDPGSAEEAAQGPKVEKQFVVLLSDPDGRLGSQNIAGDFVAWVLQMEDSESVGTTNERINRAAYEFNTTRPGRAKPCFTVGDAIENIPSKHFKAAGLWVKTHSPVLVMKTDNTIPREAESPA